MKSFYSYENVHPSERQTLTPITKKTPQISHGTIRVQCHSEFTQEQFTMGPFNSSLLKYLQRGKNSKGFIVDILKPARHTSRRTLITILLTFPEKNNSSYSSDKKAAF